MPLSRTARLTAGLGLAVLASTGCRHAAAPAAAAPAAGAPAAPAAVQAPSEPSVPSLAPSPSTAPSLIAPAPSHSPSPSSPESGPAAAPSVPNRVATARPSAAPAAPKLTLRTVDWSRRPLPANCAGGRRDAAVYIDLDGDGQVEAALPLHCPAGGGEVAHVLVYAGSPAAPRLVGDALPSTEPGRLQAVQTREEHLVVGSLGWSGSDHSAAPDTLVTTRWRVSRNHLQRTDRWEDPAEVLTTDGD